MLPPDATRRERMLWAGLAAIIGVAHDGPELATDQRKFQRLEAACRSFGVPQDDFDSVARRLDFYYYRSWDCYVGRETWLEMTLRDSIPEHRLN